MMVAVGRSIRAVRRHLPPVNFITLHYFYFIFTSLLASVILWGSSTPPHSLSYVDALFLATSAITEAGLNTVNLSTLNTFQQIVLFLLIIIGSAIFVSAFVVLFRRRAFEQEFAAIVKEQRARGTGLRSASWTSLPFVSSGSRAHGQNAASRRAFSSSDGAANGPDTSLERSTIKDSIDADSAVHASTTTPAGNSLDRGRLAEDERAAESAIATSVSGHERSQSARITFSPDAYPRASIQDDDVVLGSSRSRRRTSFVSARGVGVHPSATLKIHRSNDSGPLPKDKVLGARGKPVGRNSAFHGLTDTERAQLGGVEYRALVLLSWLVPTYWLMWQLLGSLGVGAWVAYNRPETPLANGINPWWLGAFNAVSAFNNSGMSVLDANMTAFQDAYYMLITMGLLILAGNTCYPIFLRLIIWTLFKLAPETDQWEDFRTTLRFLLDHPRRCYTNLFPSRHTWWLLSAVIVLNSIDWLAFEVLNIGNVALTTMLPINLRVIDGLFQALAVRSGGFYVVPIPVVRISLQVLYVVMMYISVYPVVITMRNSNVYEERSLGIYSDDPGYTKPDADEERPRTILTKFWGLGRHVTDFQESRSYFVRQQIRAQLAHDIWWLVLAVFVIMIIEGSQFESNPQLFSVFNVLFDTVSGYGTVGISVGVPYDNYSFCGAWKTLSKLILCAVMLRGRHRGLPVAIDRAVVLPSRSLGRIEEEDAMIRLERSVSRSRGEMS